MKDFCRIHTHTDSVIADGIEICPKCFDERFYNAMAPRDRYYEMQKDIARLWAERDDLIEQKIALDWLDMPASKASLSQRIDDLAEQAETLQHEATRIYNDPATWETEKAPALRFDGGEVVEIGFNGDGNIPF